MATVYDLDGVAHEKPAVDCRECCREMGWSMTPPDDTAPQVEPPVADQFTGLSVAELRGWLDQNNRPYPPMCKKADLLALCRG